jgi:hypothetical protein
LMGFWRKQIIMSILAECQAFCAPRFRRNASKNNGLRATVNGLSKNKIPYPRSVDIV